MCTQTQRIVLSRGITGINKMTRGLVQLWFDMVDWRSANIGRDQSGASQSIEGHTRKLKGEFEAPHTQKPQHECSTLETICVVQLCVQHHCEHIQTSGISRPCSATLWTFGAIRESCLLVLDSVTSTPQWIRQSEAVWLCVWCLCAWCLCVSMCSDILGSLIL
jgi:hypothetical protein